MSLQIKARLTQLENFARVRDYAGYDPYDALNSPILRILSMGTKWGRVACTQALKRCPVNFRPLLGIRPGQNPKGLGLFLEGYARLHRLEPRDEYFERASHLIRRLAAQCSLTKSGHGWGYNFGWQSRAFFLPRFTPTVVCSSFVGHALLDAAQVFGIEDAYCLAVPIGQFILHDLNRTKDGDCFCFSYSALDHYAVHNASLLGASLLIRLHRLTGATELRDAALAALAYSMKHQRADGSWHYSERVGSQWIDSFHTGFNLEAIRRFLAAGEAAEYQTAYNRGAEFYADQFFEADGTPKYYQHRTYPIDTHAAAEAITFFSDEGERYIELRDRILEWTIRNLFDQRGFFVYQKGARFTNRIPYMRWAQAWMFRALTAHLSPLATEFPADQHTTATTLQG